MLLRALAKNWWLMTLRGVCAVLFGVLALTWPHITLAALVLLFGVYAMADGLISLYAAIRGDTPVSRWWLALVGALGVGAGLAAFFMPGATALVLLYLIAAWAILVGALEIIGAIRLRKEINDEWMLILSGLLAVAFGAILFMRPAAGALAITLLIGAFAIVLGVMMIMFSLRLRNASHKLEDVVSRVERAS